MAERRSLELFTADQSHQVALIAKRDGVPVGTCLLVQSEIDPNHAVTPWLAGLFVAPEHRKRNVGAVLVSAIEHHAPERGFLRLYLHTVDAVSYCEKLGWYVLDRTMWKGLETALMARDLSARPAMTCARLFICIDSRPNIVDTALFGTLRIAKFVDDVPSCNRMKGERIHIVMPEYKRPKPRIIMARHVFVAFGKRRMIALSGRKRGMKQ